MTEDTIARSSVMPSATPSDADIAEWQALPRDEQLRRMRLALSHAEVNAVSTLTMEQIRELGRAKAATRRG